MPDNAWIVVGEAAKPYDGRYPLFLPGEFEGIELGWAKQFANRLVGDLDEGMEGVDAQLFLVLALVAMRRAGKIQEDDVAQVFDRLNHVPFLQNFHLEGQQAADADPPPPNSTSNGGSSGPGSPQSSKTESAPTPEPSGTPDSDTSVLAPTTPAT